MSSKEFIKNIIQNNERRIFMEEMANFRDYEFIKICEEIIKGLKNDSC